MVISPLWSIVTSPFATLHVTALVISFPLVEVAVAWTVCVFLPLTVTLLEDRLTDSMVGAAPLTTVTAVFAE